MSHPSSAHVLAPLADACVLCHPGDCAPVLPHLVVTQGDGLVRTWHRHAGCGAGWSCWRDPGTPEWPVRREMERAHEPLGSLLDELVAVLAVLLDGEELEAA